MKTKYHLLSAGLLIAAFAAPGQATDVKEEYQEFESAELVPFVSSDLGGAPREASVFSLGSSGGFKSVFGFEGISQYNVASFGRNFIPPDTMGAVGTTQFTSFVNGGFGVFDKSNGNVLSLTSDTAFWAAAGRTGANGDSRVLFDKAHNRWIALSFAASVSTIQIAVSDTADATGTWKSTAFVGFAGGTADYPTLAMDNNAVYIGTNNFNASGNFRGTTLNVIPVGSLLDPTGPSTTGLTQIVTPYSPVTGGADGGFAIQGVNSASGSNIGHVIAASLFTNNVIAYDLTNPGPGQTKSATVSITQDYAGNNPGRQPNQVPDTDVNTGDTITSNDRVIDTLDQRIGSSVYEVNGRVYSVYTTTPINSDQDHTYVHYLVTDAKTKVILDQGDIGDGVHDYYQGSLAVNSHGQVVIAYNRSGSEAGTGNITFAAVTFNTAGPGKLVQKGGEIVLKVSAVDDYHNGSLDGQVASGRQRWGDYSAVTLDPTNDQKFWAIGEYAREYNTPAAGHPGGTGGSRWSTWISGIVVSGTPEPATWAMMLLGFGFVGMSLRRRKIVAKINMA